jgi:hypothetical protein
VAELKRQGGRVRAVCVAKAVNLECRNEDKLSRAVAGSSWSISDDNRMSDATLWNYQMELFKMNVTAEAIHVNQLVAWIRGI